MTHPTNPAYDDQTYMVEFEVPGALDGLTLSPEIRAPSSNQDPQSIYRPEVPGNLGLIDPDYVVEDGLDRLGTRSNRFIGFVWIDASVAGDGGAVIEVVDVVDGTVLVQKQIAPLAGLTTYYNKEGFVVPQGSLIRISGFAAGLEPHRVRLFISYLTEKEVVEVQKESMGQSWATVLANGNVSGGEDAVISEGDFLSLQGNAFLLSDTLANLQAKGTSDGIVAEKTVAWVTDRGVLAEALTVLAESSTWGQRWTEPLSIGQAAPPDANERFVAWNDGAMPASQGTGATRYLLQYPGELRSVSHFPASDPGLTDVKAYLDQVLQETQSYTPGGGAIDTRLAFSATTFIAGQYLAIGIDPTNLPGITLIGVELDFVRTLQ